MLPANEITEKNTCQRCGRCCFQVGRTFWKAGNLKDRKKPFGDIEELNKRALNGDHEDGDLPCEMLYYKNGKATCLIQKKFGYKAKPVVCKGYPEDGELCFRETGEDGDTT